MTMRIHKEYTTVGWKRNMQEIVPFRFGLKCFSIKPHNQMYGLKLRLLDDKKSMVVEVNWQ